MPRKHVNARVVRRGGFRAGGAGGAESVYGTVTSKPIVPEAFTSLTVVESATELLRKQSKVKSDVGKFARAAVAIWGGPVAPRTAADFWRRNALIDPESRASVPPHIHRNLGAVLGWAVVEHHKPADQGGHKDEPMGLFSPIRMQAGAIARTALLQACGNDKSTLAGLELPIPAGITAVDLNRSWGYPRQEDLEFRLPEYPQDGQTVHLRVGPKELSVGYNPVATRHYYDSRW